MRKKFLAMLLCLVTALGCALAGCSFGGGGGGSKEYTVQYSDDDGLHTLTVTDGLMYSIESIPSKTGYDFIGLFDSESGGTQHVNANGTSVAAFSGGSNLVLYPQWKAKEYTVVLDYQDGDVTGSRQVKASYGSSLPELPANVTKEHGVFSGWYTQENGKGVQVADKSGLIPVVSVVNETNFNLNSEYIYLYAGFDVAKYTVTLNFGTAAQTETVEVEYNTNVTDIVYTTRNANSEAVLSWSETADGTSLFTGKITGAKTLYAVEWAPAIEFNTNGGEQKAPVVARAGATISLTDAKRDLYKFMYWEDANGSKYTSAIMPSESITLKAVWQAKLVFDVNGGSDVDDISVAANNKVTLPVPEKDGYVFAGWYTADKERYTSTTMPSASVQLKAGWYKAVMDDRVDKVKTSFDFQTEKVASPTTQFLWYKISLSQYLGSLSEVTVRIDGQFQFASISYGGGSGKPNTNIYSKNMVSSDYLLWSKSYDNYSGNYNFKSYNFSTTITASSDVYISFYITNATGSLASIKGFYYTVTYPDTTTLYL
ncbi:MAG: InlB B-repeat-containing protein [Clostridia bacterium]|nr:InlB B-repeat-containing protein [Clostridia bacterium]